MANGWWDRRLKWQDSGGQSVRIAILFGLMMLAGAGLAMPQEGYSQYVSCDNNRSGKSKDIDHTCECVRAQQQCDPDHNDPDDYYKDGGMGKKCTKFCDKEHCDCQNPWLQLGRKWL